MYNLEATTYVQPCSHDLCSTFNSKLRYNLCISLKLVPMYNFGSRIYAQHWIKELCTTFGPELISDSDPEHVYNLEAEPMYIIKSTTYVKPMYNFKVRTYIIPWSCNLCSTKLGVVLSAIKLTISVDSFMVVLQSCKLSDFCKFQ